jgi:hypothetical protein
MTLYCDWLVYRDSKPGCNSNERSFQNFCNRRFTKTDQMFYLILPGGSIKWPGNASGDQVQSKTSLGHWIISLKLIFLFPLFLLVAWIRGNPHTTWPLINQSVELHWWTCGDKVIGYNWDLNPGFFDPGLNILPLDHQSEGSGFLLHLHYKSANIVHRANNAQVDTWFLVFLPDLTHFPLSLARYPTMHPPHFTSPSGHRYRLSILHRRGSHRSLSVFTLNW